MIILKSPHEIEMYPARQVSLQQTRCLVSKRLNLASRRLS